LYWARSLMETGFVGKVTSAADGPREQFSEGVKVAPFSCAGVVAHGIAATRRNQKARPTRNTQHPGKRIGFDAGRNVRLWPADKTRYVAPCRDNKDATFHRRRIASAGKKRIGNNRTTTGPTGSTRPAVANGVAALAFAAASACIEPSGLYDRSGYAVSCGYRVPGWPRTWPETSERITS
jgi:hypothetical protein